MSTVIARKRRRKVNEAVPVQEESLEGVVERIIFHNPENGYSVIRLSQNGNTESVLSDDEVIAVGHLSRIREGDEYVFRGAWKDHPKFGRQFHFTSFEVKVPHGNTLYLLS